MKNTVNKTPTINPYTIPGLPNGLVPVVLDAVGLTKEKAMFRNRKRELVDKKHKAMYLFRKKSNMSLHAIAKEFRCDHSTVIYGIRHIEDLMWAGTKIKSEVNELLEKVPDFKE